MSDQLLVVVLPVYNEADSICAVLSEIKEAAVRLELSAVRTTCIVVDDESPDETGIIAQRYAEAIDLELTIITGKKSGLGDAMLRGLAEALSFEPTAVVTLDGDGQHNPFDIPTLYRAFTARQADIAIGSRWTRGGSAPGTSPGRAWGSRIGNWAFRAVTGTRGVKDATTSFRVYSPAALRHLLATDSNRYGGYSFFSTTIALAEAAGYLITEVPIEFRPRYSGQSKLNRREVWRYFSSLSALRYERRKYVATDEPYRATEEISILRHAKAWNNFVVDTALNDEPPLRPATIVEVGAGRGGITETLRCRFPTATITAIEPDAANHGILSDEYRDDPYVEVTAGTLADNHATAATTFADLVLYVNVLEHIEDDIGELKQAHDVLRPGGYLSVFVPALEGLYGPIDAKSGHFRRYTTATLREVVEGAGFDLQRISYAERLGVMPYWLNYRFLNKSTIPGDTAWAFDRVYVPVMRIAERFLRRVPIGKNVVCLARRPPR